MLRLVLAQLDVKIVSYPPQPSTPPGEPDGVQPTPSPGQPDFPYGQQPFAAAPGDVYGQPPYPGYSPLPPEPQPRTSRLAVTGLILAVFLPLVGLILSIVAFFRTGPGKLGGRGLAVAGMITAVVVGAGAAVTTVVVLAHRSQSTDPGCAALRHPDVKVTPSAGLDFQNFVDIFNRAADKARRTDVRNALRAMANDYRFLEGAVGSGSRPPGQMPDFAADLKRVQSLCALPTTVRVP